MNERRILKASLFIMTFMVFVLSAFLPHVKTQDDWEVPAKYIKMKNPMEGDSEAMEIGLELYVKHCKSCHGKKGLGDGPKSAELETACGDFTSAKFQKQSDGKLFYKTTYGRDDMPAFDKKISDDEDRWAIVSYVRTFAE